MKLAVALLALAAVSTSYATIYDETANQSGGGVSLTDGNSVSFLPYPADLVLFSDDASTDFNPQDAAHIESVLEGWSGAALTFVGQEEVANGGASYSTTVDANVYAIHYDNRELIFGFSGLQSGFSISGLSHGFSNMRAYTCDDCGTFGITSTPVPIPAAAWLFGTGLIGLSGVARSRQRKV